jgi:L,D-transpeptidase YcbB
MRVSRIHALTVLAFALALATPQTGAGQEAAACAPAADGSVAQRLDFRLLERALTRYRVLAADASLLAIASPGRTVRPGDSWEMVSRLRVHLIAFGDLSATTELESRTLYHGELVEGVRRFQLRHGLPDDGIIGPATLAALQAPLTLRVSQIERALERMRAEPSTSGGPFITVNVPAYRLFAFDGADADSAPALDMRVIVGRSIRTPTPSLNKELRYLEFQPYWNVPRSILVKEIIPAIRRDSTYLRREAMELVGEHGEILGDSGTAETLRALRGGSLRVRQRPGASNPLGTVKFVIPNDSNVFLHDTPNKALFSLTRRDFSHGCIRLQDARDLAIWVMRGKAGWTDDSVTAAMAGRMNRLVPAPRTIPVFVEYSVALATADGRVWFPPDVYGRDSVKTHIRPRGAP